MFLNNFCMLSKRFKYRIQKCSVWADNPYKKKGQMLIQMLSHYWGCLHPTLECLVRCPVPHLLMCFLFMPTLGGRG